MYLAAPVCMYDRSADRSLIAGRATGSDHVAPPPLHFFVPHREV